MSLLSGWFESKKPVMTDEGIQEKAPIHREVQLQNQFSETARTAVVTPPNKEIHLQDGWEKGSDNSYTFVKSYTKHGVDSVTESVYKGKIFQNNGSLKVFYYSKDVSALAELEEKEKVLEGRRAGMTLDTPGIVEVTRALSDTRKQIRELKRSAPTSENSELLLEETCHANNENEYREWCEQFMKNCITEVERHSGHKRVHAEDNNAEKEE